MRLLDNFIYAPRRVRSFPGTCRSRYVFIKKKKIRLCIRVRARGKAPILVLIRSYAPNAKVKLNKIPKRMKPNLDGVSTSKTHARSYVLRSIFEVENSKNKFLTPPARMFSVLDFAVVALKLSAIANKNNGKWRDGRRIRITQLPYAVSYLIPILLLTSTSPRATHSYCY